MKAKLLKGYKVRNKTFKIHFDGYNLMDHLAGKATDPRHEFFYFNDDGSLVGLRYHQWKLVFAEQRAHGFDVWQEPFVTLRLPKLFNLRSDPFEQADHIGIGYNQWRIERVFRSCRRSSTSGDSWPHLGNFHRAKKLEVSVSTKC